jgi:hypothetical protein
VLTLTERAVFHLGWRIGAGGGERQKERNKMFISKENEEWGSWIPYGGLGGREGRCDFLQPLQCKPISAKGTLKSEIGASQWLTGTLHQRHIYGELAICVSRLPELSRTVVAIKRHEPFQTALDDYFCG